jgi:hypothetical protein
MHVNDGFPFIGAHVEEKPVAEDAGIVDDAVDPAEIVKCRINDAMRGIPFRDALMAGRRLTTTLAPWAANASANSRPIPAPAPVTTTTLSCTNPTIRPLPRFSTKTDLQAPSQ